MADLIVDFLTSPIGVLLAWAICLWIYFAPTIYAIQNRPRQAILFFIFNLFLGWNIIVYMILITFARQKNYW